MVTRDREIEAQARPNKPALTRDVPMVAGSHYSPFGYPIGVNTSDPATLYNPDDLGFRTLDKMRSEPTLATALTLLATPILRQAQSASIHCEDPSIKRYLEFTLLESGLWYSYVKGAMHALWAGMQTWEKVWDVQELDLQYDADDSDTGETLSGSAWSGPALVIRELRECNPETVRAFRRRIAPQGSTATTDPNGKPYDGSFDGFYWSDDTPAAQAQKAQPSDPGVWIPPQKALVYTHDKEFGNFWGKPRIRGAYPSYYWLQRCMRDWMAWLDRKVVPPRVMRAPPGLDPESGEDNTLLAAEAAEAMDNQTTVVMSSETNESGSKYLWDMQEFPVTDRTQVFTETRKVLQEDELNAVFVPPRVFSQDQVGSFSSTAAFQDLFLYSTDALQDDVQQQGNRYLTQPMAVAAFGTNIPQAEVLMPGLTDEERALLTEVLTLLMANPTVQDRVDFDAIASQRSIPLKPKPELIPGATPPGAPAATDASGAPVPGPQAGAPAPAPSPAGAPAAGPAPNLVLDDLGFSEDGRLSAAIETLIALSDGEFDVSAIISLAAGFDAERWDVRPDSTSTLKYAVYDKHLGGRRLTGFAAKKVIESWQKQAAAAGKKAQTEQNKLARQGAAAAKKASKEAEMTARASEREALKQQKELERQQKAAEAEQKKQESVTAQQGRTVLAVARAERAKLETTTKKMPEQQALDHLRQNGWDPQASSDNRDSAVQDAHSMAADNPDYTYTIVAAKGRFIVARKATKNIVIPKSSPNVAADDSDVLWQEAQARLLPLFAPEDTEEDTSDDGEEDGGTEGEGGEAEGGAEG